MIGSPDQNPKFRFGLLSYYNTGNLGDEIQSIAVRRMLPVVDYYIDRDRLSEFRPKNEEKIKLVCNGWFSHRPQYWPPAPEILPLLISMHFTDQVSAHGLQPSRFVLSDPLKAYLMEYGPVGARDLRTQRLLQDHGIDSYFSGCATLTLKHSGARRREDIIVLNDVPDSVYQFVRARTKKAIISVSNAGVSRHEEERFGEAEQLLSIFETASCVITTRLHAALPCLALETPVLLLDTAPDQYRFEGLSDLARHCRVEDFLSGYYFDFREPSNNPNDYLSLRESIVRTVDGFVRHDKVANPSFDFSNARNNALIAQIGAMNARMAELEARNRFLEDSLATAKRDHDIGMSEACRQLEITRRDSEAVRSDFEKAKGEIAAQAIEISRLEEQLGRSESRNDALLQSTSWRATAPLRWIRRTLDS